MSALSKTNLRLDDMFTTAWSGGVLRCVLDIVAVVLSGDFCDLTAFRRKCKVNAQETCPAIILRDAFRWALSVVGDETDLRESRGCGKRLRRNGISVAAFEKARKVREELVRDFSLKEVAEDSSESREEIYLALLSGLAWNPDHVFVRDSKLYRNCRQRAEQGEDDDIRYGPGSPLLPDLGPLVVGIPREGQDGKRYIAAAIPVTLSEVLTAVKDLQFRAIVPDVQSSDDWSILCRPEMEYWPRYHALMVNGKLQFPCGTTCVECFPAGSYPGVEMAFAYFVAEEFLTAARCGFQRARLLSPTLQVFRDRGYFAWTELPQELRDRVILLREQLISIRKTFGFRGICELSGFHEEISGLDLPDARMHVAGLARKMIAPLNGATSLKGLRPETIQLPPLPAKLVAERLYRHHREASPCDLPVKTDELARELKELARLEEQGFIWRDKRVNPDDKLWVVSPDGEHWRCQGCAWHDEMVLRVKSVHSAPHLKTVVCEKHPLEGRTLAQMETCQRLEALADIGQDVLDQAFGSRSAY